MRIHGLTVAVGGGSTPTAGSPDLTAFSVALVLQAVPCLAALVVSVVSALSLPAGLVGRGYRAVRGRRAAATVAP